MKRPVQVTPLPIMCPYCRNTNALYLVEHIPGFVADRAVLCIRCRRLDVHGQPPQDAEIRYIQLVDGFGVMRPVVAVRTAHDKDAHPWWTTPMDRHDEADWWAFPWFDDSDVLEAPAQP